MTSEADRKKLIEVILKMQDSNANYKDNCVKLRDQIEELHTNNQKLEDKNR